VFFFPILLFPGGNDLLAVAARENLPDQRIFRISLTSHEAVDLGELPSGNRDAVWAEPGKTLLLSRTINGLTNIWKYSLQDRSHRDTPGRVEATLCFSRRTMER
jgi:hypothetical protein